MDWESASCGDNSNCRGCIICYSPHINLNHHGMAMRTHYDRTFTVILLCMSIMLFGSRAYGVSRSNGLGVRTSFWNITNHPTRIRASEYGQKATVDIGGIGAYLYFSSRLRQNAFLEFHLGMVGGVHQEQTNYFIESSEASAIVPILFGIRYDLLSTNIPTAIQPYIALGGGPYWTSRILANDIKSGGEAIIDSKLKYGVYAGGGVNLMIASWLALNCDFKYHFVDFKVEREYSGLEFGLGFSVMWGRENETFQVKEIKVIVRDIYPVYYQFYNTYPLALVSIKNVASYPIEVNVKSEIDNYSERPGYSGFTNIPRGKTVDIPVTVIFGSRLQQVTSREPAVLDLEIIARTGKMVRKVMSAAITVHNRNAWNGDVDKLAMFVTPDEERILRFSRESIAGWDQNSSAGNGSVEKAQSLFDALGRLGMRYHSDPSIPFYKDDRVQYAAETLQLGSGDCDDLVVLYASLLHSLGINTAFAEVRDPQKEIAHLYLLFDTGVSSGDGNLVSSNEKRYVIRENADGKETIWIPVETTLVGQGFEEAWKSAATTYLQESIIRNGINDGWVRIIDVY